MIACKQAVEMLWSYLDRNLERAKEEDLEKHLGLCRHCCGELEFAKQIRERLASGGEASLPPKKRGKLESFLRRLEAR